MEEDELTASQIQYKFYVGSFATSSGKFGENGLIASVHRTL